MKRFLTTTTALSIGVLTVLAGIDTADAQSRKGTVYAKGNIGFVIPGDIEVPGIGAVGAQEVELDSGLLISGGVGYQFNRVLSVEGEFGYRTADVDTVTVNSAAATGVTGDSTAYTFMGNLVAQFGKSKIKPFLGGGAGLAIIEVEDYRATTAAGTVTATGDDNVFAYQFLGGVDYELNDRVSVGLDYRYMGFGDLEFSSGATTVDGELDGSHNFTIGAKYRF